MQAHDDHTTRELTQARLTLRANLIFTPQRYGDEVYYHVEHPDRNRFFRIGLAEYTFISLLDGDTSVAQAASLAARALGANAFTQTEAVSICSWLLENDLAATDSTTDPTRDRPEADRRFGRPRSWNPFWMRVPLANPGRLLDALVPVVGWMHTAGFAVVVLIACTAAVVALAGDWNRFETASTGVFAPDNWLWLGLSWLGLKFVHELSHAVACRKRGGAVNEMGVIFILLAPLAYVDATSSWRFRSRWERIHVAAAGMYVELLIAAAAALWWTQTDSPLVAQILHAVVVAASVSTLVFNANPLMRFDGYYILSDLAGVPNLYAAGQEFMRKAALRLFFGTRQPPVEWRGRKGVFVRVYGIAAFAWRILVTATLLIGASVLFHGLGVVLAATAAVMWFGRPAWSLVRTLRRKLDGDPSTVVRAAAVTATLAGLAYVAFAFVPWPFARRAPGVVEFVPSAVVRAEAPGFVREILVRDGQIVEQGELLAVVSNRKVQIEERDLELAVEQSTAKRRIHIDRRENALAQVEAENGRALEKQIAEARRRVEKLTILAPISGRVTARDLARRRKTWLKEGDVLLEIGGVEGKELRVAIAQSDVDAFRSSLGRPAAVRLLSGAVFEGRILRLNPRATKTPYDAGLVSPNGGPLTVRQSTAPDGDSEPTYELLEPHFEAFVSIPHEVQTGAIPGVLGTASTGGFREPVGKALYRIVSGWFERQQEAAEE